MTDVVQSEPGPAGALRITRGGVLVFATSSLIGAGLGVALLPRRPMVGAVLGTLGGFALPTLLVIAVLAPLAKAKVSAVG